MKRVVTGDSMQVLRTGFQITTRASAEREDREFWWKQTPVDRLRHLEVLRSLNYGPEVADQRLQRVLTVLERPRR
jgi:hypothetical protein